MIFLKIKSINTNNILINWVAEILSEEITDNLSKIYDRDISVISSENISATRSIKILVIFIDLTFKILEL